MMRLSWTHMRKGLRPLALALVIAPLAQPLTQTASHAQGNPFTPVIKVNDQVITRYEMDQRMRFLQLLNQPGDLREMARKTLIEDRLRLSLAKRYGASLPPEAVQAGMEEFAARANLTAEQLIEALGQAGVDAPAFRDFVTAGLLWREIVKAKYGPTTVISEADIDRALASFTPQSYLKLSLSEIVLPLDRLGKDGALALARRLRNLSATPEDFASAARSHSAAASARAGGKLPAMVLADLPAEAMDKVRTLGPDQVSEPILTKTDVRLYLLHESQELPLSGAAPLMVDFAEYLIPNDGNAPAELARLRASSDDCDDLFALARGLPPEQLLRQTLPQAQLPKDTAAALSLLDPGEIDSQRIRQGWRVATMLCSRQPSPDMLPTREMVRQQLLNQRLGAMAEIFLEELRSEALIRDF